MSNSDFSSEGSDSEPEEETTWTKKFESVRHFIEEERWSKMSAYEKKRTANIFENNRIMREDLGLDVPEPDFVLNWRKREEKKRKAEEERESRPLAAKQAVQQRKRHRSPISKGQSNKAGFQTPRKKPPPLLDENFSDNNSAFSEGSESREKGRQFSGNVREKVVQLMDLEVSEFSGFGATEINDMDRLVRQERDASRKKAESEAAQMRERLRAILPPIKKPRRITRNLDDGEFRIRGKKTFSESGQDGRGSRYPKRNLSRVDYAELESPATLPKELDDKMFPVYCAFCKGQILGGCIEHPIFFVGDSKKAVQGSERYAYESCPDEVEIGQSSKPKAGMGVFAKKDLKAGTGFGPYTGRHVENQSVADGGYSWEILQPRNRKFFVDGKKESEGNWMRFVNHPIKKKEHNLASFQSAESIYYVTMRNIPRGAELFVYYGEDYHRTLVKEFPPSPEKIYDLSKVSIFKCQDCDGIAFTSEELLQNHQRRGRCRGDSSENRAEQKYSKKCSSRELKMNTTGERLHQCAQCGYRCSYKGSLLIHIRTVHEKRKDYICDVCGADFGASGSLKMHKRIHSKVKPFKCSLCDKRFTQSGDLLTHERIHTGERPYECKLCHTSFTRSGNLLRHERIHTGERPYECKLCHTSFTRSGDLLTHERIHTGERPYECKLCHTSFTRSGDLLTHERIHTGERPYECKLCHTSFTQSSNLLTHERRVHKGSV